MCRSAEAPRARVYANLDETKSVKELAVDVNSEDCLSDVYKVMKVREKCWFQCLKMVEISLSVFYDSDYI